MNKSDSQGAWSEMGLTKFYDFNDGSIERNVDRLSSLNEESKLSAINEINSRVMAILKSLDNEMLPNIATSMTDDLYKFAVNTQVWGENYVSYVSCVWKAMINELDTRGFVVRYFIDNTWPNGIERPLGFLNDLFSVAGFSYLCPLRVAADLRFNQDSSQATDTGTLENLQFFDAESRMISQLVIAKLVEERKHFVYLEADFRSGCLDFVKPLTTGSGIIYMGRTEAASIGSKILILINGL